MPHRKIPADKLSTFTELSGKKVLEVGGGMNLISARRFMELGAESVIVSNIAHGIKNGTPEKGIETRYGNAHSLTDTFPEEAYDIVYGVAVIEHIPNLDLLLQETYKVLKPGGYAFFSGGPIWTCAVGHHIWVNGRDREYRFTDQKLNPIPNWGHLLYTPEELSDILKNNGIPDEDISKIMHWITQDTNINRKTYSQILNSFYSSKLDVIEKIENTREIENVTNQKLMKKMQSWCNFGTSGFNLVLQKN